MKNKDYILCIEGVPGSGKTTLAYRIDKLCCDSDLDSFWVLEENRNHPITPSSLRQQSSKTDFGELCIKSWKRFTQGLTQIAILEGCAFQSTIRFMFANNAPIEVISNYIASWEQVISSLNTRFVLLVVSAPFNEFVARTCQIRGETWTEKVSNYISRTPFGKSNNLYGIRGMEIFWSKYQSLCVKMTEQLTIPCYIADINETQWEGLEDKVYNWAFNQSA